MKTVPCPHCKKPVVWAKESMYRPFCSERCRIIDLGAWADGSYSVPSDEDHITEEDLENLVNKDGSDKKNDQNPKEE